MRAIFAGSFDPITLGHLDVMKRLAGLYSEVIVLVSNSDSKSYLFNLKERMALVQESLGDLKNILVCSAEGLTADFAKAHSPSVLVRSVRNITDFDYEKTLSEANRLLAPGLETVFILARPEYTGVASSLVKEIARQKGDLDRFVSPGVKSALLAKFK